MPNCKQPYSSPSQRDPIARRTCAPLRRGHALLASLTKGAAIGCLALALYPMASSADDLVELRSGGVLRGRVVGELDSGNSSPVTIELEGGGTIHLIRGQISRVQTVSAEEREYAERLASLPDTVEAHWELAQWCDENRLREQRDLHRLKVIQLDPNHEDARHSLGYSLIGGRWMTRPQVMLARGLRLDGRLPGEHEVIVVREAFAEQERYYKRELRIWRNQLNKARHAENYEKIMAVRDPAAISTIVELLEDETTRDAKQMWIEVLGAIDSDAVTDPLIRVALLEDDESLRELALKKLERFDDGNLQRLFMAHLDPNDNSPAVISRAGVALAKFGDREAVRSLIEALVTRYRITNPNAGNQGQIGAAFGSGGGFQVGPGQPRNIEGDVQNPGVLVGLREITGVDYGFSKSAWLDWYVQDRTPAGPFDLRRGPQ